MNTPDLTIEIDGKALQVKAGSTIIEAADAVGIQIPRFCYHKKLSVAANCRMCMVEVEKAPKPVPACSTPVVEGMKIATRSVGARDAQQGTMEFLLINHPLDCPICDQGGECELQDVSLNFGSDVSRFTEGKRVVVDPDLGPLISTDMNRCIHCTRCVRFGEEVAGIRELGATGRGEFMAIGTFVEKSVDSEVSGNIIDICPVGALTAKPSRYKYRPWELVEHAAISPFDGLGSNLKLHLNGRKVTRVVPADNEQINECWIADRDRYFYEGLYTRDRATQPQLKINGQWQVITWDQALKVVIEKTRALALEAGVLASPSATTEELYLLQKLARELGIESIDHRLRMMDFRNEAHRPQAPLLGCDIDKLHRCSHIVLIAANVRKTLPVLALRLRAAAHAGVAFSNIGWRDYELPVEYAVNAFVHPNELVPQLATVARQILNHHRVVIPDWLGQLPQSHADTANKLADELLAQDKGALLLLGAEAINHPDASIIRGLCGCISNQIKATVGYLAEGGNAVGASVVGALPKAHHTAPAALNAQQMLASGRKAYWLFNVEPNYDFSNPKAALTSVDDAEFVVSFAVHTTASMYDYSDVILPIAAFSEKAGSTINLVGQSQSFFAATQPPGEAKSAWAVLRMLGVTAELDNFSYPNLAAVQAEIKNHIEIPKSVVTADVSSGQPLATSSDLIRVNEANLYQLDPLVRRSKSLQKTADARDVSRISAVDADRLSLKDHDVIRLTQGGASIETPVLIDKTLSQGVLMTPAGSKNSSKLAAPYTAVIIDKVVL